jgi:chromate transport protein ChrA
MRDPLAWVVAAIYGVLAALVWLWAFPYVLAIMIVGLLHTGLFFYICRQRQDQEPE